MVQEQAISFILNTGSINGFRAEYFTDKENQFLFIQDFVKKYGKVPDKATFIDKFREAKVFQVDDPVSSILERLKEETLYKRFVPLYNQAGDMMTKGKTKEACDLIIENIERLSKGLSNTLPPVDLSDSETKKMLYRQLKVGMTKFPSGRPEIDEIFGGWNSKDYVVLFSRLGIGKSWVAEFFAYNLIKNGYRVGYYSGEMSAAEISLRVDTFNTNKSNRLMYNGEISENEYERIADSFAKLPGKLYVVTPIELGGSPTVNDLKNFIENQKLQALFIDQVSLMKRNPKLSKVEAYGEIADDLRVLQSMTGIPFFIVSQQNRRALEDKETKNKDDLMASISYSDSFGQNATLAIYLDYNKDNKILTLDVVKNRRGSPQKLKYSWDIDHGEIRYIPESEDDGEEVDQTDYGDSEIEIDQF
jgi:replicative DNA helicase